MSLLSHTWSRVVTSSRRLGPPLFLCSFLPASRPPAAWGQQPEACPNGYALCIVRYRAGALVWRAGAPGSQDGSPSCIPGSCWPATRFGKPAQAVPVFAGWISRRNGGSCPRWSLVLPDLLQEIQEILFTWSGADQYKSLVCQAAGDRIQDGLPPPRRPGVKRDRLAVGGGGCEAVMVRGRWSGPAKPPEAATSLQIKEFFFGYLDLFYLVFIFLDRDFFNTRNRPLSRAVLCV